MTRKIYDDNGIFVGWEPYAQFDLTAKEDSLHCLRGFEDETTCYNDELRNRSEEKKIIFPSIKKLKKNNYKIIGPFSADTIFLNKKKYKYDVIIGMYHDQVLAPFKTIYGFDAINITLGLKYIRISPDHGIAKDIVGSNKANPLSLIKAVKFILKN